MLNLSLAAVARAPVRVSERIASDHPAWSEAGVPLKEPLQVDLEARMVGEGVLVRGEIETEVETGCRRCLVPVSVHIRDSVELLYEPLTDEEEAELGGEVYPLPARGDQLDLFPAIREQIVLRMPDYVICGESCRGLCPQCGADLNRETCSCAPEDDRSPWDALKKLKFD